MAINFNPNDMELTPMIVYWKPHGSTTVYDPGGTLEDVKISVAYEKSEIMADQTGKTPLDKRVSGAKFSVTTAVTQVNNMELLQMVFPHAALVGTAPYGGDAPSAAVQWNNVVGQSDLSVAGELVLHPQNKPVGASGHDWTFYVACPTEASEITFGPTKQSALKIEWTVYPDTSVSPYRFLRVGDVTIV